MLVSSMRIQLGLAQAFGFGCQLTQADAYRQLWDKLVAIAANLPEH